MITYKLYFLHHRCENKVFSFSAAFKDWLNKLISLFAKIFGRLYCVKMKKFCPLNVLLFSFCSIFVNPSVQEPLFYCIRGYSHIDFSHTYRQIDAKGWWVKLTDPKKIHILKQHNFWKQLSRTCLGLFGLCQGPHQIA